MFRHAVKCLLGQYDGTKGINSCLPAVPNLISNYFIMEITHFATTCYLPIVIARLSAEHFRKHIALCQKTFYQEDRRQRRFNRGLNQILGYGNISNLILHYNLMRWSLYLQNVGTTIMESIVPRIVFNIIVKQEQCVESQMESVHRDVNQASKGRNV